MQSESTKNLAVAMLHAQAKFKPLEKTAVNPFFKSKYAPLDAVIEATREALAENGLVVVQMTDGLSLRTVILHESGEWIDGSYPLNPAKLDPQGVGAAVTYARRYALQAAVGVCADEDDDGEGAMARNAPTATQIASVPPPRPVDRETGDDPDEDDHPTGPTKGFRVMSVNVKRTGTSNRGPYTLYSIEFDGGAKGTTFSDTVAKDAKTAFISDRRCAVEFGEYDPKYKSSDIKSLRLL